MKKVDEKEIWNQIAKTHEKILKDKRIKHRNFGIYSKHSCGYETCDLNGLMIEQGSFFAEHEMRFNSNKNKYSAELKSKRLKKERKKETLIINSFLTLDIDDL